MEYFRQLGDLVEQRLGAEGAQSPRFPEIAVAALNDLPPQGQVTALDIVRWVQTSERLPARQDLDSPFGEPPITFDARAGVRIETYFWVDGTTAIHQHGFHGAFCVLEGSSIQSVLTFEPRQTFDRLQIGDLRVSAVEHLELGAVRPIEPGDALIHSVFHLERPTVTLCIRARASEIGPQPIYLWPHFAIDVDGITEIEQRRAQLLRMLQAVDHPEYPEILQGALFSAPPYELVRLLNEHRGSLDRTETGLAGVLRQLRRTHGGWIDDWIRVASDLTNSELLVHLRADFDDPDDRYVLALCLNVRRRDHFLDLLRRRFPDRDLAEVMAHLVQRLAARLVRMEPLPASARALCDPGAPEMVGRLVSEVGARDGSAEPLRRGIFAALLQE